MKKYIIGFVLEAVIDMAISALQMLSLKTSSKVDDKLVSTIIAEKENIIAEIKMSL